MVPSQGSSGQSDCSIVGKQIEIATEDGKFDAYLSAPDTDKGPGVIMVSSIFGVDQGMKDMCDDLSRHGCVALAQNFFWRDDESGPLPIPAGIERAVARVGRLDFGKSVSDLRSGIAEVRRHPNYNGKLAVFGFCFGGPYAWRSACDGFGVDAAMSFHGTFVSKHMKPGDKPSCPVIFHYGENDDLAPREELDAVKRIADATGNEFVIHPDAGHGYMLRGDHYHDEAARKSWERALQMVAALRT
jgi:carboxymethylenebutenolidase